MTVVETTHVAGKGRAKDLPFPGTIVSATRRRCRLTALETAARDWYDRQGADDRPARLVPPDVAIVAAWLKRLRVPVVEGTLDLYQVASGSTAMHNRRQEWRAEFDIRRRFDVYLNAKTVGRILGMTGASCHKTAVRLIQAGFLAGFEADPRAEYVYGHRGERWGRSVRGRQWRVHPDDLARFLLEHPEQYERERIRGKLWRALAAEGHRKRRWFRVPEVAERLGCSPGQVRDMLRLGDLQGVLMRDRRAISWYIRPEWLLAVPRDGDFTRTIYRRQLPPNRQERRARILAEREGLQAQYDADARRLLYEVRDIGGRRRKAAEAAAFTDEGQEVGNAAD